MKNLRFKKIILVSMDATSPQRLSCCGYKRITTPQINQALSEGGAIFKNAFSQAPYTVSSHASMLTSLYLLSHKVTDRTKKLSSERTLASVLQQSGFATAGFTSHPCLSKKFGFDTGFDTFANYWRGGKISLSKDWAFLHKILKEALRRVAKRLSHIPRTRGELETSCDYGISWVNIKKAKPFFLFIHLFSAHPHYNAPPPFAGLFLKDIPDKFKDIRIREKQWDYRNSLHKYPEEEKSQVIELLGRLHDEEIAYNDNQVGTLIVALKKLNIYEDTLIIVTSDHGNFLPRAWQRKERGCLFDENIRVPLLFINPSLRPKQGIECLAQVIDIFPTVLSFAGIDIPPTLQGKDLKEVILNNAPSPHQYIYANHELNIIDPNNNLRWNTLVTAIRSREWKFRYEEKTGKTQLYDLTSDAEELNNLSNKLPEKVEEFLKEYQKWKEKTVRYELAAEERPLNQYEVEQLRALGYID